MATGINLSSNKAVKIRIVDPGDPSVGIFEQSCYIDEEVYLEDEDRETFRQALKEAFEYVMDSPQVRFSDEEWEDYPDAFEEKE